MALSSGDAEAAAGADPERAAGGGPPPPEPGGGAAAASRSASSERPTARNTIDTASTQPTPKSVTAAAFPAVESPATASTMTPGGADGEDGSDQSPHANQHNPRDVRAGLVAAGRHLPDLPALVRRLERRWGGGPEGHHVPPRLPAGARRRGDLAVADLHEPDGRLRLRRRRLPRRRPDLRHARRPRRADRGVPRARHQGRPGLGPEPHVATATRGSRSRDPAGTTRSATGTCGATSPTTGSRSSRPSARRGRSTHHRAVLPAQLHGRAARPQLGQPGGRSRRCTTCCGSGWTAASTACGWTRSTRSPRTRCSETTPTASRRHDQDWESIHDRLRGIRKVVDEYDDRMIVGEVALEDLHRIVAYLGYGDQLHLAHNFVFIDQEWDAETYATSIADFERLAEHTAWPAWFLGNHDKPRPASRFTTTAPAASQSDPRDALRAERHARSSTRARSWASPTPTSRRTRSSTSTAAIPERAPIPWTPDEPAYGFTTGDPVAATRDRSALPQCKNPSTRTRAPR